MSYILVRVLCSLVNILEGLIFLDAISTWILPSRSNSFLRAIGLIIDPILQPCSKIQQRFFQNLPMDFSPLIAILLLELFRSVLVRVL